MKSSIELHIPAARFGIEKAIEMIAEAGFEAFDFSFYWNEHDSFKKIYNDCYKEYAKHLKNLMKQCNIECNQAHATFKPIQSFDETDEVYSQIVREIEFASLLGAKCIIIHAQFPPDNFYKHNYKFYKSFEPYCKKFGIKVAVENLFQYINKGNIPKGVFGDPQLLEEFVKKLNSPYFTACLDIGHASMTGSEPEDFISKMDSSVLTALHVQDNDYTGDKHWLPFTGLLNWDNITAALKEINYEGDITLEVMSFLSKFDNDLLPYALKLAAETAKKLIYKISE